MERTRLALGTAAADISMHIPERLSLPPCATVCNHTQWNIDRVRAADIEGTTDTPIDRPRPLSTRGSHA